MSHALTRLLPTLLLSDLPGSFFHIQYDIKRSEKNIVVCHSDFILFYFIFSGWGLRPVQTHAPPLWGDGQRPMFRRNDAQFQQRPPSVTSVVASSNSDSTVTTLKVARSHNAKRTNSPSLTSLPQENPTSFHQGFPKRYTLLYLYLFYFKKKLCNLHLTTELGSRSNLSVVGFRPSNVGAEPVR